MFAVLTVLALNIAPQAIPSAPPEAACRRCSLTGMFLAQAEPLPPPPLPGFGLDAPERRHVLEAGIAQLDAEIRGFDTNWPVGPLLLGFGGYLLAGPGLIGGGGSLLIALLSSITSGAGQAAALIILAGGASLLIGLAGVYAIIVSLDLGKAVVEEKRRRRNELIEQRERLREELEILQRKPPSTTGGGQLVTVFAF